MKQSILVAAAFAAAGCASIQIPPERLEQSRATVRGAEELGALQVPRARLHLQYAKDEEAWARQLAASGNDNAELMLACAQSDADLALALAREAQVHRQTVQAADEVNVLRAKGGTP